EDVAAGSEAIEVRRETPQRLQQLAADQERQVRRRADPEDDAHVDEGLERAREAPPGVLRPLGDAGHLAVLLGDEGDDAVRLTVRAGAEHECRSGDLFGHGLATAQLPRRPVSRTAPGRTAPAVM